jgi:hypothetical protein
MNTAIANKYEVREKLALVSIADIGCYKITLQSLVLASMGVAYV